MNPLDYTKIVVYTDSTYVADNYERALFTWSRNGWLRRDGNPVENTNLWKELVRVVRKAGESRVQVAQGALLQEPA